MTSTTIRRVLIANRGEIAVRIVRALADTGRTSIAVYADQDADALHVRLADEAWALDGTASAETYLNAARLIEIATAAGADAVHPGYGFLSESGEFARMVEAAGLVWIGPSPESIALLGDKVSARALAERVGAPLAQGSDGPVESAEEVLEFAGRYGLPIVIKAAHGGGGRGMRVVRELADVEAQYDAAVREATVAFGRGECFVEQFLERPRHIEVQVLADTHGTVLALGTRDCSLQRRNQKLVEEAPAPFLTGDQERTLLDAAQEICSAAGYRGAGTVEFLLDPAGTISFLEVNTRLQVEHPVTEEVHGIDLVDWQLRIAEGEALPADLATTPVGHAIEFRINAEDAGRGYLPTPGTVTAVRWPNGPGVRVDAGVEAGGEVAAEFDSLIAKLIVTGPTREVALARSRRALAELVVDGVATVAPFHRAVLESAAFTRDFAVHTRWIETEFAETIDIAPAPTFKEAASRIDTWIEIDGKRHRLAVPLGLFAVGGEPQEHDSQEDDAVVSPLAGVLAGWSVEDGARVEAGATIAIMEAMKMETPVVADRGGTIELCQEAGARVQAGEVIARLR